MQRYLKKILITLITLITLLYGCSTKISLKKGDLTGYCGTEIVQSDTGKICFVTDTSFIREGTMYLSSKGSYYINRDSLFVNYFCETCKDTNSKLCCSIQVFIKTNGNKLKIVEWRNSLGQIIPIPKEFNEIELNKIN